MSLKSTICVPNITCDELPNTTAIGFVGISSVDQNVYIWQLNRPEEYFNYLPPLLAICRGNPLVPSSWCIFKELELNTNIGHVQSCFNASCTKMAFRCHYDEDEDDPAYNELLLVDITSGQIETRAINQLARMFAETSVGWVEVSSSGRGQQVSCYKTFPVPGENKILLKFAVTDNAYQYSWGKITELTYDSLMYITLSNSQQHPWKVCKLVSYDFSSGNSTEIAFDQWNPSIHRYRIPFLIANSNRSYLIRPSQDLGNRVYLVEHDHLGIKLTYLNQIDDGFIGKPPPTRFTAGDNKIAMIHFVTHTQIGSPATKLLTVAHIGVPSLKSLAVWAIQKHCGRFGNDGELLGGISEEKLKKEIGYQGNKKLF